MGLGTPPTVDPATLSPPFSFSIELGYMLSGGHADVSLRNRSSGTIDARIRSFTSIEGIGRSSIETRAVLGLALGEARAFTALDPYYDAE